MAAIKEAFGSFEELKGALCKAGATQFGSGWAWLVKDKSGKLAVTKTLNAENPLVHGETPLLTVDVRARPAPSPNPKPRKPCCLKPSLFPRIRSLLSISSPWSLTAPFSRMRLVGGLAQGDPWTTMCDAPEMRRVADKAAGVAFCAAVVA